MQWIKLPRKSAFPLPSKSRRKNKMLLGKLTIEPALCGTSEALFSGGRDGSVVQIELLVGPLSVALPRVAWASLHCLLLSSCGSLALLLVHGLATAAIATFFGLLGHVATASILVAVLVFVPVVLLAALRGAGLLGRLVRMGAVVVHFVVLVHDFSCF